MNSQQSAHQSTTTSTATRRYWKRREQAEGLWPWGWLPLLGLIGTFLYGLVFTAPQIQAHTTEQVTARLKAQGVDVIAAEGDGQHVMVRAAGDPDTADHIRDLARATTCRTWYSDDAVCPTRVDVEIEASGKVQTATPAAAPVAAETRPAVRRPHAHRFHFTREGDRVTLTGKVPSEQVRRELVAKAETLFTSIEDNLDVTGDQPASSLDWAIGRAMTALTGLQKGDVTWIDSKLSVRGWATEQDQAGIREAITGGANAWPGSIDLQTVLAADRCNAEFEALLAANTIRFATGSAQLLPDSQVILQRVLQLSGACPHQLEISGHTDSRGDPRFNLDLSSARADAVRLALVNLGVPPSRLTARGYGATQPVADNATQAGRAENRRIEITAMGVER